MEAAISNAQRSVQEIKQGLAEVTIGTAAMLVAHLEDPALVTGAAPYIGGHAVAGKWDAEGGAFSIGSWLKWWRDNFGQIERTRAEKEGTNVYDILVDSAREAPAGSRGSHLSPVFRRAGDSILFEIQNRLPISVARAAGR
jgi:xylulokinase